MDESRGAMGFSEPDEGSVGCSYWTKRRKVLKSVNDIMEETSLCNIRPFDPDRNLTLLADVDIPCPVEQANIGNNMFEILSTCDTAYDGDCNPPSASFDDLTCFDDVDSDLESSCSSTDISDEYELAGKLSSWALNFNISLGALNELLKLLHDFHHSLPLNARTLLKTPDLSNFQIKPVADGSYYYFGVASGLSKLFDDGILRSGDEGTNEISLQINIDGLPIYKSTNYQLWPILGMAVNVPTKVPFVIGLYGGNKKPADVFLYLRDFVNECCALQESGVLLDNVVYIFRIHSILCDAPARAFVRNTKGHTAYYGCDRCIQSGKWSKKMTYPETAAPKRTDESFRSKANDDYHLGDSPLSVLSIDLVFQLPLDYMHLVCLGVMRRLILAWIKGPLNCRLPAKAVRDISSRLIELRSFVPSEFSRKPRPLSEVERFKATEFRQILLYTGMVVFRNILPDEVYKHFMLLSCSMYCFLSPKLCYTHCSYANELMVSFVKYAEQLYGSDFLVYNVHSLIHVSDDVLNFGPLDTISCFPYENYLRQIKKSVRSSFLPFHQVIGRLTEMQQLTKLKAVVEAPVCCHEHFNGPEVDEFTTWKQYKRVKTVDFVVNLSAKDSCLLLKDGSVAVVKNILMNNEQIMLVVALYANVANLYSYPLDSSDIDVYSVSKLNESLTVIPLNLITCKCVHLPLGSAHFAVIPLLHSS